MDMEQPSKICETQNFCTGSSYTGELDKNGKMTGFGIYRYPCGTEYRGHFKNGVFHGRGIITNASKFKMCGYFINGKCDNFDTYFRDGLEFEDNWKYCIEPDRRFWVEITQGISPVSGTYLTKEKPSRIIPRGFYDTEEGFFDPKSKHILDAVTGERIRYVCSSEVEKIMKNCRMNQSDFEEQMKLEENVSEIDIFTDSWVSSDGE